MTNVFALKQKDTSALKVISHLQENLGDVKSIIALTAGGDDSYDLLISDNLTKAEVIGLLHMAATHMALKDVEE